MSFLGSSSAEKSLGSVADSNLQMSQQCFLAVKMVNSILPCMNGCTARRLQEGIICLISPHLDNASSFGGVTQYKKDIHKLGCVQGRATKMVGSWSTCPFGRGWGTRVCSWWGRDIFSEGMPDSSVLVSTGKSSRKQSQALDSNAYCKEEKHQA